ncbi:glycoside hydrolase family 19 protein [Paraburkholderia sp. J41]|uniref:glycoside hydrolase family 19 protein n=1 Tax=Paraburkholderia sp. J41 TaxID=2805433 RepID=UPI002AC32343|nr:glycoside hydrolase family 19 protein [Paraburkholderia sp. J41]
MNVMNSERTNEEYRNKNGSTPSGWSNYHGGSNFHGRGLIQLTHDENYIAYGNFVGDTTIGTNPDKVSNSIDHTTHSACWYWRHGSHWGDINPKADNNDFYAITVAVNGGFNHVDDRFVALNKLAKLLGAGKCATNPGLVFNDYQIEKSSLYGSNFYKTHTKRVNDAVEAVDAKKSTI